MIFISFGMQCTNAVLKNDIKKTFSFPFDYMFSTPFFVFEMLKLLLEENMEIEKIVKEHFFVVSDKKLHLCDPERFFTCDDGGYHLHNVKYNVIFPHDENNNETIEKYIRRFQRLKDYIINSTEQIYFLYTSQPNLNGHFTIDDKQIIENEYEYLTKIFLLIKKWKHENFFQFLVFDAIQEKSEELLDKNIVLYKLSQKTHWFELLPEIKTKINEIIDYQPS